MRFTESAKLMLLKRTFQFMAIICVACLMPVIVNGQGKLYVLIASDTEDVVDTKSKIGKSCRADLNSLTSTLDLLDGSEAICEVQTVTGQDFTRNQFENMLNQVLGRCGPDDAIYVHYSGHGSFYNGDYQLELKDGSMGRSELVQRVRQSPARLKIIVSDACASVRNADYLKNKIPYRQPKTIRREDLTPLFRRLFLEASGIVDLVAAEEGQVADSFSGNGDKGGIFTSSLLEVLQKNKDDDQLTWDQVFSTTAKATNDSFQANWPEGLRTASGQTQYAQTPKKLELMVNYRNPEPTVVEVDGPLEIDPRDGSIYSTRQTLNNGVVVNVTRTREEFMASKIPASDGSWMWTYFGQTVLAQNQSPPQSGFWSSTRLGASFFDPPDGNVFVVQSFSGTPGNNLRTHSGGRWTLDYGESIRSFAGKQIVSLEDLRTAIDSADDQFSLVVFDGFENNNLTGSFSGNPGTDIPPDNSGNMAGRRHMLGVVMDLTPNGEVVVTSVTEGGPATQCKNANNGTTSLEPGDQIYSINGNRVTGLARVVELIEQSDRQMRFQVRDINTGNLVDLTTTLALVGDNPEMPNQPNDDNSQKVSLGLNLTTDSRGVRVDSVTPDSPATRCVNAQTGATGIELEPGDYIVSINGTRVSDHQTAIRMIQRTDRNLVLEVRDQRTGNILQLTTELRKQ